MVLRDLIGDATPAGEVGAKLGDPAPDIVLEEPGDVVERRQDQDWDDEEAGPQVVLQPVEWEAQGHIPASDAEVNVTFFKDLISQASNFFEIVDLKNEDRKLTQAQSFTLQRLQRLIDLGKTRTFCILCDGTEMNFWRRRHYVMEKRI